MKELVGLKQQGIMEQFHDAFVSLLNQVYLLEPYALTIFLSNLRDDIGQYLELFESTSLIEGFRLARKVEGILFFPSKLALVTTHPAPQSFSSPSVPIAHSSTMVQSTPSS